MKRAILKSTSGNEGGSRCPVVSPYNLRCIRKVIPNKGDGRYHHSPEDKSHLMFLGNRLKHYSTVSERTTNSDWTLDAYVKSFGFLIDDDLLATFKDQGFI